MTWKDKVEAVKKIPIPKYMEREVVPLLGSYYGSGEGTFAYKPVEKCPFHNEDTASFRYYEETNTCSCFGCRRGGDIINLHRLVYETNENIIVSYKEAVEHLYKVYVEGQEDEVRQSKPRKVIKFENGKAIVEDKNLNNTGPALSQILRYNKKVYDAENRILKGNGDVFDTAMLLDFTCKLHRLGEISIEDATTIVDNICKKA